MTKLPEDFVQDPILRMLLIMPEYQRRPQALKSKPLHPKPENRNPKRTQARAVSPHMPVVWGQELVLYYSMLYFNISHLYYNIL